MSSAGRGKRISQQDFYPTPNWCIERFLENGPRFLEYSERWLEPCAGDGRIVDNINAYYNMEMDWTAIELQKTRHPKIVGNKNFFAWAHENQHARFDVCLTNPPFSLAWEFLHKCLEHCDDVLFLLRINFLGSEHRHSWMSKNLPDIYILPNRPSFLLGKTDSTEYAWFHWGKHVEGGQMHMLDTTPLEERRVPGPKKKCKPRVNPNQLVMGALL